MDCRSRSSVGRLPARQSNRFLKIHNRRTPKPLDCSRLFPSLPSYAASTAMIARSVPLVAFPVSALLAVTSNWIRATERRCHMRKTHSRQSAQLGRMSEIGRAWGSILSTTSPWSKTSSTRALVVVALSDRVACCRRRRLGLVAVAGVGTCTARMHAVV